MKSNVRNISQRFAEGYKWEGIKGGLKNVFGKASPENFKTFYHGTTSEFALDIRKNGIDLTKGRTNLDFGQGFYTTESLSHATSRANQMVKMYGGKPEVLEFSIPTSSLNKLNGLSFSKANLEWQTFVKANRTGSPLHNFDYVSGPAWRRYSSKGETLAWDFPEYNQTSLHTKKAAELFMKGLK